MHYLWEWQFLFAVDLITTSCLCCIIKSKTSHSAVWAYLTTKNCCIVDVVIYGQVVSKTFSSTFFMLGSYIKQKFETTWNWLCKMVLGQFLFFFMFVFLVPILLNSLASARIRGFSEKERLNVCCFAWEFLQSGMLYRPSISLKRRGKSSGLHSKKNFCLGARVFCEWHHKWRTFRPPWPMLPGPGRQPLDGSISLKFLLETRLQSESFDTLDDLLRFQVQKLWCKLVKIFD